MGFVLFTTGSGDTGAALFALARRFPQISTDVRSFEFNNLLLAALRTVLNLTLRLIPFLLLPIRRIATQGNIMQQPFSDFSGLPVGQCPMNSNGIAT